MRAVYLETSASLGWLLVCFYELNMALASVESNPGDLSLIRERQVRVLDGQRCRLQELRELRGKKSDSERSEPTCDSSCFPIHEVLITGAEHLFELDRQELTSSYLDHCLGTSQLNDSLMTILIDCLGKGWITSRADLFQQDLSSSVLSKLVVERHLEMLLFAPDSGLSSRELAISFPRSKGELINLRDVDQMLDQLNRLPSNQAQMKRVPGQAAEVGDVLVRSYLQKPWRASLSHSDDGQKSTGEQQCGTSLDCYSPLGFAEQLVLRSGDDAVGYHQLTFSNAYATHYLNHDWWIPNYSYKQCDYHSKAQVNGFDFKQICDSQNHELHAERVIHRDALSKTSMIVGLSHRYAQNFIERQSARTGFQQCLELFARAQHLAAIVTFAHSLEHLIHLATARRLFISTQSISVSSSDT